VAHTIAGGLESEQAGWTLLAPLTLTTAFIYPRGATRPWPWSGGLHHC